MMRQRCIYVPISFPKEVPVVWTAVIHITKRAGSYGDSSVPENLVRIAAQLSRLMGSILMRHYCTR